MKAFLGKNETLRIQLYFFSCKRTKPKDEYKIGQSLSIRKTKEEINTLTLL